MMKALFLSILALLPAAASAQRDTLGVLERSSVFSAEDERAVAGFHTESPAMMLYRSEQSLSQISLRIDLRREQLLREGIVAGIAGTVGQNFADGLIRQRRDAEHIRAVDHAVTDHVGGVFAGAVLPQPSVDLGDLL